MLRSHLAIIAFIFVAAPLAAVRAVTITPWGRQTSGSITPGPPDGHSYQTTYQFSQTDYLPSTYSQDVTVSIGDPYPQTNHAIANIDSGYASAQSLSFPLISGECSSTGGSAASEFIDDWFFTIDSNTSFNLSGNITLGNQETGVILYTRQRGSINGVPNTFIFIANNGPFNVSGLLTAGDYQIRVMGQDLAHTTSAGETANAPPYHVDALFQVPEPGSLSVLVFGAFGLLARRRAI